MTIGKLRFLSVLWWLYPKYTLIIHIFPFRSKFCDLEMENCHKPCLPWAIPFFTRPSLSYAQPLQNFLLKFVVHFEQHGHFNFPLHSEQGRSASSDINSWKISQVHKYIRQFSSLYNQHWYLGKWEKLVMGTRVYMILTDNDS